MEMSFDRGGPLAQFLDSLGVDLFESNGETPVKHMLRTCSFNSRWIVAHLNAVLEGDLEALAASETKCHIAHCPRSHSYFGHEAFQLALIRSLGFNICLGTDSLASNSSLSLFAEMRELLGKEPGLSPREALEMTTVNGAAALGQRNSLGSTRASATADLIALPLRSSTDVFESIVAFEEAVLWMVVDGKITLPV